MAPQASDMADDGGVTTTGEATTAPQAETDEVVSHDNATPTPLLTSVVPALLLLALLAAVVLRYSASSLSNTDTWFHLSLGRHFRDDWSLGHPGALTQFATSDWLPTQWSTEILASYVDSWFGLPGVAWLFGTLYLTLIVTVYVVCRQRAGALASGVVTGLVVFAASATLSARPQVVSLVLLVITVHAWLRTAEDGRPRWWLVPLTWVWATAHGLWSAGILVGLVCCLGLVLDRRLDRRRALLCLAVPLLSLVVTAATPVGPRLLTSQFAVSARASLIPEWGATSFRTIAALVAAGMIAWLVILWSRGGRVSWIRLLLLMLAAGWVLLVTRMVALGAVTLAPMLAQAIGQSLPGRTSTTVERRVERGGIAALCAVYLGVLAAVVPTTAAAPEGVPTQFEARLDALPEGSPLLVEDGVGAWVEWRVPGVDPVIDGLLDAYSVDYIRQFYDFKKVAPGWQDFVNRSGARDAVLLDGSPASAALQDHFGWTVVQKDRDWIYLKAPASP
jgi:hypothetical protein